MESLSSRRGTWIRRIAELAVVILYCIGALPASACDDAEAAEVAKSAEAANAEDPVICRKIEVTGSRLRRNEVCRPRSVWEKHEQRAKDFLKDVDRKNSIGTQSLDPSSGG